MVRRTRGVATNDAHVELTYDDATEHPTGSTGSFVWEKNTVNKINGNRGKNQTEIYAYIIVNFN